MSCTAATVRKAATLAVFAAIRAAMRGCDDVQVEFERLALRLDILSNASEAVSFDPEIASILSRLDEDCIGGFYWVVDEICTLLRCMGIDCRAKRFESEGVGHAGRSG